MNEPTQQKEVWAFTCPECGGHDITIEARITLAVIQHPTTGSYETAPAEAADCYHYDRDDYACCQTCDESDQIKYFEGG